MLVEHAASPAEPARSAPGRLGPALPVSVPVPIVEIDLEGTHQLATGLPELDRVLGGGLVPGSVTVLGGEPGIGKSTLVLQAVAGLARRGATALVVTGEESVAQVRLRAERLGALDDDVLVVAETDLETVAAHIEATDPDVVVVDSIQTLRHAGFPGAAGSVSQVREVAHELVSLAKQRGVSMLVVGHVTKVGDLAGPRELEHVVDTVLAFEGDRHHALRLLRAHKHRFGSTDELGLFEMGVEGLVAVDDASRLFLADRKVGAPGSAVGVVVEAGRPLLVEVQALVAPTPAPMPRRVAQALDGGRLAMLLAVLDQRAGVSCAGSDVFASVAGGVRVAEPALDRGVCLAVASAVSGWPLPPDVVAIGEVGLAGEVRAVPGLDRRLREAARLGFGTAIVFGTATASAEIDARRVGDLGEVLAMLGLSAA